MAYVADFLKLYAVEQHDFDPTVLITGRFCCLGEETLADLEVLFPYLQES